MTNVKDLTHASTSPPDREQRELILRELERNILVEAAAGTGKTTSMTGRMLALLESGRCRDIRRMAAVTFTRKAAAELRSRFRVELERRVREAEGEAGERLRAALDHVEQCFIGTIHSFCARLLRERPVEAGLGLEFTEIDEDDDFRLLDEAWNAFAAELVARDPRGLLEKLTRMGLTLADLKPAFAHFSRYPDVEEWPMPAAAEPNFDTARKELLRYAERLRKLAPELPRETGNDKLIPLIRRVARAISHMDDLDKPERIVEALEFFDASPSFVQKAWMKTGRFTREEAKAEKAAWDDFRDGVARPALRAWREYRYPTVLEALREARRVYDALRRERGLLNFQDLLMRAAALLRDHPEARRYFYSRYTHLLVDEFQDTDPIQAEVIFLLASSDPEERDWRACVPRPGSLFLVGDPKQSIYRFRRADITTYAEVKRVLEERGGGLVVNLRTNFRSSPPVISWVNRVFEPGEPAWDEKVQAMLRFPSEETHESPSYVPLFPGREESADGELCGVFRLALPEECGNNDAVRKHEPDLVARLIRNALEAGTTVPRSRGEIEAGNDPRVSPDDFMIVTLNKKNLGTFAQALQRYGIPHQVTGGQALNEVDELRLLHLCLRAVTRPEDPVALVAALRSELFGFSDAHLYSFRKAGGRFSFRCDPPAELDEAISALFVETFARLRRYSSWLDHLPPAAACERMAEDLGLFALAAARPGGDVQAGSLAKALELLRATQSDAWSVAQAVEYLGRLASCEEKHDGTPALPGTQPAVRVMNLHKVKGLEAPVVFLADPCGEYEHDVEVHIDRSGGKIRGYLAVYGEASGRGRGKLLAHPARWEELAERERTFRRAEELRLRYVAATRCGAAAIISQRSSKNAGNPWRWFDPFIDPGNDVSDPGPQKAPARPAAALPSSEYEKATASLSSRLEAAMSPTYGMLTAKEFALSRAAGTGKPRGATGTPTKSTKDKGASITEVKEGTTHTEPATRAAKTESAALSDREGGTQMEPATVVEARPNGDSPLLSLDDDLHQGDLGELLDEEHATEWGEIIHLLLQAAMAEPGADLERLAAASLEEKEMEPSLAPQAASLARSVMESDIWRRAQQSERRLVEVPFQVPWEDGGLPAVLRGVIDLIFREADGWVLVDYKTGRLREGELRRAAGRYAPQLHLYAKAWEAACGEPVKEALIYFASDGVLAGVQV